MKIFVIAFSFKHQQSIDINISYFVGLQLLFIKMKNDISFDMILSN